MAEHEPYLGCRQRNLDRPVNFVEEFAQFGDAFARHDDVGHPVGTVGFGNGHACQAVTVGRCGLQRIIGNVQEDAVQVITRFLGRNRKARLVDDLAQRRGGQFELRRQLAFGNHRKIVAWQRRQVKPRAARIDRHLAFCSRKRNLRPFGQFTGNIEQGVRRNRCRPRLLDLRVNRFQNLQVEIGRHQPDAAAAFGITGARFDQHVRQDGDRVAPLDHRLDVAEAL